MIEDWRTHLGNADLPFYYVLLSPYQSAVPVLPQLRLAQLAAQGSHNTGVASAIDLGDLNAPAGSIHPRNKSHIGERLARWVRRDVYKHEVQPVGPQQLDFNAIQVTVKGAEVTVVLSYPRADENSGLYALSTPGCTACCNGGAGALLVWLNGTSGGDGNSSGPAAVQQFRPAYSIDAAAYTVTARMTLPSNATSASSFVLRVGLMDEEWPQCVLYNQHGVPALPFSVEIPINGGSGGGGGSGEEGGTSLFVYVIGVAVLLGVVGAAAWLIGRYLKKRRAGSEAEPGAYRSVEDDRRTSLLGDDETSS